MQDFDARRLRSNGCLTSAGPIFLLLLCLAMAAFPASAQTEASLSAVVTEETGAALSGVVTDQTGAALADVTVTIKNVDTG